MGTAVNKPLVHVAVAVITRNDRRVLLAERPLGKLSGGHWEFPGGKFEIAETPLQALTRELHEEIGVDIDAAMPWLTYDHTYPDKIVRLHYHRVTAWHGTPRGREGQRVSWEDPSAPMVSPLLPANARIWQALMLPPVYAITSAAKYGVSEFMLRLEDALQRGLKLIQVRENEMAPEQLAQFARRVVSRAHYYGARVLINGNETLARRVGADGVHLSSAALARYTTRPMLPLVAASCHNSIELQRASELGVDFAVLSPVLPTATHPGVKTLGWQQFHALTNEIAMPVFALAGMRLELLETAMQHGAHGVALLSDVW